MPNPNLGKVLYVGPADTSLYRALCLSGTPLRFGAGIQNKVLEAMAMELPVIASPLVADGLQTEQGRKPPLETAQRAGSFARRIIQNLQRRGRSPQPESQARRFVEQNSRGTARASP